MEPPPREATTRLSRSRLSRSAACVSSYGVPSTTFSVLIWGDATPEPDESFGVEVTKSQTVTPLLFPSPIRSPTVTPSSRCATTTCKPPPPPIGNDPDAPPPIPHASTDPKDCTIAYMKERYAADPAGVPDAPEFHGDGQFFGLMRIAAKNLGPGGITDLLAGRGKFTNVLTCPTGTLLGRPCPQAAAREATAAPRGPGDWFSTTATPGACRCGCGSPSAAARCFEGRSRLRVRATVRHVDLQGTAAQPPVPGDADALSLGNRPYRLCASRAEAIAAARLPAGAVIQAKPEAGLRVHGRRGTALDRRRLWETRRAVDRAVVGASSPGRPVGGGSRCSSSSTTAGTGRGLG